jgi:hypothetical protein
MWPELQSASSRSHDGSGIDLKVRTQCGPGVRATIAIRA